MAPASTTQPSTAADEQLRDEGERLLAAGNYCAAARRFGRMVHRDPAAQLLRCFARNLAAFDERDPRLARAIATADDDGRYRIAATDDGDLALTRTDGAGAFVSVEQVADAVRQLGERNEPITLAGVGDGRLLCHVAANPPVLHLTQQQPVFVIEPDLALLRAVCMTRPMGGADGPITQPRVQWCIGPEAGDRLDTLLEAEPMLPAPTRVIHVNGNDLVFVENRVNPAICARRARQDADVARIADWDQQQTAESLTALLGDHPPRQPRVLCLTTRFSTVLQHAMRDARAAFESLGWHTQLFIESADHHRCTPASVAAAVAGYRPDLIVQIDHLRAEFGQVLPRRVPFVCWVQDHLRNLVTEEAGASIADRDFVLTAVRAMYEADHGYPGRQCIALGKLTRMPAVTRSEADGQDIVFVSNASRRPEELAEEIAVDFDRQPVAAALVRAVCRRMIGTYRDGGVLHTPYDIDRLFADEEQQRRCAFNDPSIRRKLVLVLAQKLNNTLYRQQALQWAAGVADDLGLSLGLYGSGWDAHPTLSRFARGPVSYGPDLEALTRRSRINLQIVPFTCLHQRLLDGIAAGGFFLVRAHPYDADAPRVAKWLSDGGGDWPSELSAARDRLHWIGEPAEIARDWLEMGWMRPGEPALPRLDEVTFSDAATLRQRIERYREDDAARRAVVDAQRRAVAERFSYAAGMRRVIGTIRQRIMEDA